MQPPDSDQAHRGSVGGLWDEVGHLQFEFLVRQGLQPSHRFLDVGCGSLRGGAHFIRYLDTERYVGIDSDAALLEAGRTQELDAETLEEKRPQLVEMQHFGFSRLGGTFDYALAQSVFTHLPLNTILRCLVNMGPALSQDGRFYATFFENSHSRAFLGPLTWPNPSGPDIISRYDADPYHYTFETLAWAGAGAGLRAEYIGEWGHPRGQRMAVFHPVS